MTDTLASIVVALIGAATSVITVLVTSRKTRDDLKRTERSLQNEMDERQNETLLIALRNNIQAVYATGCERKCIKLAVYSGVCEEFDRYVALGGNSYVHTLMDEMKSWDKY